MVYGNEAPGRQALDIVAAAAFGAPWRPEFAREIRHMRYRLEENASKRNLKRGPGGTVDTEFVVQMLQLRHGGQDASIRTPGTLDAIAALKAGGYLDAANAEFFSRSYRFQRNIEARIRLMDSSGRHELPENEPELAKLAYLLGQQPQQLVDEAQHYFAENRLRFERIFEAAERS
jgi:glutamate-ammonia-ligase adenylyltransferase